MSEKETNRRPEASTEDKMQELFRLMDEKAAQGTLGGDRGGCLCPEGEGGYHPAV